MRFAAPGSVRRERDQVRIAGNRQRHRRGKRIEAVVPRDAREVECFNLPNRACRTRPAEESGPVRAGQQREHQIAPCVQIVRGDHELPKARLPQILREQFEIASRELHRRGGRERRRTSNQVPELGRAALDERRRRKRTAEDARGEPVLCAPLQAAPAERRQRARDRDRRSDEEREQREARDEGRKSARRKQRGHPRAVAGRQPRAEVIESDERQQQAGERHTHRQRQEQQRNGEDRRAHGERPCRCAQRRLPPVEMPRARRTPHARLFPQPDAAVDGGEHRPDGADPAAGDEVDLDPGLVQRAQGARVIRTRRARSRQDQGGPHPRRVEPVGRLWGDHTRVIRRGS